MNKRGLGKGIGSLISDYTFDDVVQSTAAGHPVHEVHIDLLDANPDQPRKDFDDTSLQELADSISRQGVLQPVLVEKQGERYQVIAGERRLRAARRAGLQTIPVIVRTYSDAQKLEVALIENLQRENLNPIEEAKAFRYLMDKARLSQEELATQIGKRRSTVANSLRLLNLPDSMQEALKTLAISSGHARALLSVVNPSEREVLFQRILDRGLSVREAEEFASQFNAGSRAGTHPHPVKKQRRKSAEIQHLEERFLEVLGTKVAIKGDLKQGKIEISYYSLDDLERIFELISPEKKFINEL